jgi:hypothetical protein
VIASGVFFIDDYGTNQYCWIRPMATPFWIFCGMIFSIIAVS